MQKKSIVNTSQAVHLTCHDSANYRLTGAKPTP
jgi:hypothetical protein